MAEISIGSCLAYWANRNADECAILDQERSVTWQELDCFSNRLARTYASMGVRSGDFVGIMLPNGISFYEAAFAVWKLGATPFSISYRMPVSERDGLVDLARPSLLIGGGGVPVEANPALSDLPLEDRTSASWKALASGGSTGRSKIIVSKEPGLFDPEAPAFCMQPKGIQLVAGPLYHNAAFMFSSRGLFAGKRVVILPRFDAERVLQTIERHRVDWMVMVPTMMQRIWKLPETVRSSYDLTSLKTVLHTASICPRWLKRAWIDWLGPDVIQEIYGGTEGCGSCWISGTEWLEKPGSVGRPLEGFRLRITGRAGEELPAGEIGDVYMRPDAGPGTTYRYIGAEAHRNTEGWEWIGDIGYCDADGYLYLADRRTDLIIAGGANIYPAEVEAAIDRFPGVRSSAVIGLPDEDMGARVHAIVDVPDGVSEDDLREHLLAHLVPYKVPRSFEFVNAPLRDEAGKVRRSALRDLWIQRNSATADNRVQGEAGDVTSR